MSAAFLPAILDRFEGDIAVLIVGAGDQRRSLDVPRARLPKRARAGHHLRLYFNDDQLTKVTIDHAATRAARARIDAKLDRLRRGEHLINPPPPESDAQ